MIFWITPFIGLTLSLFMIIIFNDHWEFVVVCGVFIGFIASIVLGIMLLAVPFVYGEHVDDLGKLRSQHEIVSVYENRIERLEERLNQFNYPVKEGITLNADSPVASIVSAIADAEVALTEAHAELARAKRSVTTRKIGPYKFIVWWLGEE